MTDLPLGMIDVNQAELETLCALPYINRSLAEKIVAGRPYQTLQDLRRVNGIGKATVQRLEPFLTVSAQPVEALPPSHDQEISQPREEETPPPEPQPALSDLAAELPLLVEAQPLVETPLPPSEPQIEKAQPSFAAVDQPEPAAPPAQPPIEQPSQPKVNPLFSGTVTMERSKILLWGSAAALLVLFLSLLFNLGVLAAVNGGLRYARASRAASLELRLSLLNKDTEELQQETASLRTRMDNLEALTGRMEALEQESATLQVQVEEISSQVDGLNKQLEETRSQLSQLEQRVVSFDRFLEGLRSLLNETVPVQPKGDNP